MKRLRIGPGWNGTEISAREFDRALFVRGYRYELINGVVIVSPSPLEAERDPNGHLEYLLRAYQEHHPHGKRLDATLSEHTIHTGVNRRVPDRVVWVNLGRLPRRKDVPAIVIEFVSAGKRNIERDYEDKREEYMACGVREYWIIDRFTKTMTVYEPSGKKTKKRVFGVKHSYQTDLLPGFKVPLDKIFYLANRWSDVEGDD